MNKYIEFKDLLANYVKIKYKSTSEAAKHIEINRATLTKIMNGQRCISNLEEAIRIGKKLMLTTDEFENFVKSYKISKMGVNVYRRRNKVQNIIDLISNNDFEKSIDLELNEISLKNLADIVCINNKLELNKYIRAVIYSEFNNGSDIKIIAQPCEELNSIIYSCANHNHNKKIIHYFCMDNNFSTDDFNEHNLDVICNTVVLALSGINYQPMYYYDNAAAHFNSNCILPCAVVTENYTIAFDYSMQNGIVYKNQNINEFYKKIVLQIEKNSEKLFAEIHNYNDILDFYSDNSLLEYEYCYQPCVLCSVDDAVVEKHINLPEEAKMYYMKMRKKFMMQYFDRKPFNIFYEKGLEDFVENGKIYEIPEEFYTKPTPSERKQILKNMVRLITEDKINLRACKENVFKGSKTLIIVGAENFIRIVLINKEFTRSVYLKITEPGTVFAFNDYFKYLINEEFVYSKEETIDIIKNYIKE